VSKFDLDLVRVLLWRRMRTYFQSAILKQL